jgi:hypothetical protein
VERGHLGESTINICRPSMRGYASTLAVSAVSA